MLRFAPYVLKTLWRHRMRTFLTMSGAAVALFVYSMVTAVQQGLDNLKSEGERTLIVFQANKFCPATSQLQQDYDRTIEAITGVRKVLPIQVYTNNCRASLDVIVFYGVPADRVDSFRKFQLVEGNWQEFASYQDAALVGQQVAWRRGLQVGQKFSIGEVTVTVAGIFAAREQAEENYIYTHLEFLQRRGGTSRVGTVTQFEVQLEENANPEVVSAAIDDQFRGGPVATDTRTKGVFQTSSLADLFDMIALAHYLAYACVGVMVVLVSTTSLMSIQDRLREHAVLQTIGFTPWRIFSLVMAESLVVSLVGGSVGIALATVVLAGSGLSLAAEAVAVSFSPSLGVAALGLMLAALIGVVAGAVPAWQAARTEIVVALRQG